MALPRLVMHVIRLQTAKYVFLSFAFRPVFAGMRPYSSPEIATLVKDDQRGYLPFYFGGRSSFSFSLFLIFFFNLIFVITIRELIVVSHPQRVGWLLIFIYSTTLDITQIQVIY